MSKNAKGSRRERELLDKLVERGFVVHRIAGSGKGEDAICDLIAIDSRGKVHLYECKSRKKVYYPREDLVQLNNLVEAAKRCKARPVLAVKLNYKDWIEHDLRKEMPKVVR